MEMYGAGDYLLLHTVTLSPCRFT